MSACIGIRHEDKYKMERRTPLTPKHVKKLIQNYNLKFCIEKSQKRIFKDNEYLETGAKVCDHLDECSVIMGVKEMPVDFFQENKTYIFFSHVIKGQAYNMPMLKKMMTLKCNLIDYEKVSDEMGRRLIFFGRYAGLAGMINTLWSLGLRLKEEGFETPLLNIKQTYTYDSLEEARKDISRAGQEILEKGLPKEICPLTIGFTGYGNVSNGAQEIAALLPLKEIEPYELANIAQKDIVTNVIYKSIFKEHHLVKHKDQQEFDLQEYYTQPDKYRSVFEQYIPNLSVLMNCMYWDEKYPKLLTREYLKDTFRNGKPKLIAVGDITCDIDGSVESTVKGAEIEDPVYMYNPENETIQSGVKGNGLLMMTVDILPSELPRESSFTFGDALFPFVKSIAETDFSLPTDELPLPGPIKNALILHNGKLTRDYKYIERFL